jgi:phage-related minor tail protein
MDDTIETLMVGVRADTAAFAADAATMQGSLQGALGSGASKAATLIENSLAKAIRTGKLSFEDLGKTALSVLSQIAEQAVKSGLSTLFGTGSGGRSAISGAADDCGCVWDEKSITGGGLLSLGTGLLGSLLGLPGRATGGPVSPGRAYRVGENGPETFVPASAGSIIPAGTSPAREVRVAINVNAPSGVEPQALARSSRQVARAVSRALAQAER